MENEKVFLSDPTFFHMLIFCFKIYGQNMLNEEDNCFIAFLVFVSF